MNFDKVIMNPPYGKYPYPHIRIATRALNHSDYGVLLCPSAWVTVPFRLKEFLELKEHISGMDTVFNTFDAEMGARLGIFTWDSSKEYSLYKDLPYLEFKYPYIAKDVFKLLYEEKRYPILWDKCIRNAGKVNKDSWYVGVPRVRGHLDIKTSKPKWDYYTLCSSSNKPLKGELYDRWVYIFEFVTEKEAITFREYLDSEIVGYLLRVIKRGHGDSNLINYMPYPLTLEELAENVAEDLKEPYIEILEKMKKDLKNS